MKHFQTLLWPRSALSSSGLPLGGAVDDEFRGPAAATVLGTEIRTHDPEEKRRCASPSSCC
jgi:hypothetical protein